MKPVEILQKFNIYLAAKGLSFEAVVIGGAALAILGTITRETQDCDVLSPKIPAEILHAARDFSREIIAGGGDLKEEWLNNGPTSLLEVLPREWRSRKQNLYSGKALKLEPLGRPDLLRSKFFAYCDRQQDLPDCIALKPTKAEILETLDWLHRQDAHPGWPEHVSKSMSALAKRLGYDL
ncbi:MAG: hypothetical protein C5B49_14910 [Bdellovibrio sp.]|nr:MAG: hypothetical protein C5B49_14910 [Bdellovibrio sp.]